MTRNEGHHELRHAASDLRLARRRIDQAAHKIEEVAKNFPDCTSLICAKNEKVLDELIIIPWHPMLKEVVFWGMKRWPGQVVFTSGHREGDKGVHGALPKMRGTDWRSTEFSNPRVVEQEINQEWEYGKEPYRVCTYHRTVRCEKCGKKFEVDPDIGVIGSTACLECHAGGGYLKDFGPHFHLQSRDQTRRKS